MDKKAYGEFTTALSGLLVLVMQLYLREGPIDGLLVFLSFIPFVLGLLQGIFYLSRHELEYIYLGEDLLTIHNGLLLLRTTIKYNDIAYCTVISNLLVFQLNKCLSSPE